MPASTVPAQPAQPAPVNMTVAPMRGMPANPLAQPRAAAPIAGEQCVPGDPNSPCAPQPIDLVSGARQLRMPNMAVDPMSVPARDYGFDASQGGDPYQVWRAQSLMAMANRAAGAKGTTYTDPSKAVAAAAMGGSVVRANELMAAGLDYNTAVAMAQREATDAGGYRAAGYMSGATPEATNLMAAAGQREADRQAYRGGTMSPTGQALYGSVPGIMVMGEDGRIFQTAADGNLIPMGFTNDAQNLPANVAGLLGGAYGAQYAASAKQRAEIAKLLAQREAAAAGQLSLERLKQGGRVDLADKRTAAQKERDAAKAAEKAATTAPLGNMFLQR